MTQMRTMSAQTQSDIACNGIVMYPPPLGRAIRQRGGAHDGAQPELLGPRPISPRGSLCLRFVNFNFAVQTPYFYVSGLFQLRIPPI